MIEKWPEWIRGDAARIISVDVETSGPNPADYDLLSIGACTLIEPRQTFYVELQPVSMRFTDEALQVHGLDLKELQQKGKKPADALEMFKAWLAESIPSTTPPLFLGFNAPFDWMFVNDYFFHYLGENPFGHSALDIKSFYMGAARVPWGSTSMKNISQVALKHNALQDACDQASLFARIVKGVVV